MAEKETSLINQSYRQLDTKEYFAGKTRLMSADHSFQIGDILEFPIGRRHANIMVIGFIHDGIPTEAPSPFLSCLLLGNAWQQMNLHHSLLRKSVTSKEADL